MARHATRKEKALHKALRDALENGVGVVKGDEHVPLDKFYDLKAGLRNVNRTATNSLDAAGVPESRQGDTEDWEYEARDYDILFGPGSE